MLAFIKIGFLPITLWDVLDVFIVGYLIYRVYKLLRGSIAFNIFVGVVSVYALWWLVSALNMDLLASILNQFVNVGVLMIIIIFQPEVRRFLLFVGSTTLKGQTDFMNRLFKQGGDHSATLRFISEVKKAAANLSRTKTGALIVFSDHANVQDFSGSGVVLDADVSAPLLQTIFFKDSPLHDGAAVISSGKLKAAGCVLPVSKNLSLPEGMGLRHRAGVGITEGTDALTLIISEETGGISIASEGKVRKVKDAVELEVLLKRHFETSPETEAGWFARKIAPREKPAIKPEDS